MKYIGKDPNIIDNFYTATASGALSDGDSVVVNSNSTLSKVSGVEGGTGTATTVQSGTTSWLRAVHDSNSNKTVIFYRSSSDNYIKARVLSISGTTVTLGSEVSVNSYSTAYQIGVTFDSNSNKVVIIYNGNASGYPFAQVGTVSGTSISFGTATQIASVNSAIFSATFDTNSNKVVVMYKDYSNNKGAVQVGTVSGTSISFGSAVFLTTGFPGGRDNVNNAIGFDSNSNKILVTERDNNGYGSARVGTVSGTSISFGTPTVYDSNANVDGASVGFNTDTNTFLVVHKNSGNELQAYIATISGTSVSFGTPTQFEASGNNGASTSILYISALSKFVVCYNLNSTTDPYYRFVSTAGGSISIEDSVRLADGASAEHTTVTYDPTEQTILFSISLVSNNGSFVKAYQEANTNVTAGNFIGFADHDCSDGEQLTVATVGCINDAQSGLTAGQSYFVTNTGSLSTSGTILAGTAISATEIVVKE